MRKRARRHRHLAHKAVVHRELIDRWSGAAEHLRGWVIRLLWAVAVLGVCLAVALVAALPAVIARGSIGAVVDGIRAAGRACHD
jgi:hypothetical protein